MLEARCSPEAPAPASAMLSCFIFYAKWTGWPGVQGTHLVKQHVSCVPLVNAHLRGGGLGVLNLTLWAGCGM